MNILPTFRLDGLNVVVTGGQGRIGSAIVAAVVEAGGHAISVDRIDGASPRPSVTDFVADLGDVGRMEALANDLDVRFGFGAWINSAYPRTEDWASMGVAGPAESWRRNVDMQMTAVCVVSEHAAQKMAARGGGALVTVSSIYGMVAPDFHIYDGTSMTTPSPYAGIKGGLIAHTRYLASLLGSRNVRANVVAPGGVSAGQPASFVAAYSRRTALGRMAKAEEIGSSVVFLCSPAASYITGAVLPVDGGWTAI